MTKEDAHDKRRTACIIIQAKRGYVRKARGLVARAITQAIGRQKHGTEPYILTYCSDAEMRTEDTEDPRYLVEVTDEECEAIVAACDKLAASEGWPHAPIDVYHD